jgi:hypothetical protein
MAGKIPSKPLDHGGNLAADRNATSSEIQVDRMDFSQ